MSYNASRNKLLFVGLLSALALVGFILIVLGISTVKAATQPVGMSISQKTDPYVVVAWNDLGMHCYNRSFKDLAVLPPFNTLWAQVILTGDPPQVITTGITVEYFFADNTYSVGKSDFWDYDQQLFGVNLAPNMGLKDFGLSGEMAVMQDHFQATGIPLTEFSDSDPTIPYPYQLATIVVKQTGTGTVLAQAQAVAPVSTEMHCDTCHYNNGPGNEDVATGVVEQNILTKHDQENMDDYPVGHQGALMGRRPVLCAECHASNALEMPGGAGLPSLSNAMHEKHDGIVPDSTNGCYNCHPGPQTKCLRDVMSSSRFNMTCVDCHGTMYRVSNNPDPWLNEPRCDDTRCHGSAYQQDQPLYRMSKEHGGVYCEGCHDSPHAIAPSREANDAIKFFDLQNHAGPLDTCTVCHTTWPTDPGPHNLIILPYHGNIYLPLISKPNLP